MEILLQLLPTGNYSPETALEMKRIRETPQLKFMEFQVRHWMCELEKQVKIQS